MRKKGVEAYPRLQTAGFVKSGKAGTLESAMEVNGTQLLPVGGISNWTTVLCNESGEYITFESDEHGFHNPKKLWHSNHVQVAALGDNCAVGYCVPSRQNFVALIRNHYPATLNLAMDGDGPLFELAKIKEYLPVLRPEVVLWFYNDQNDIGDLEGERYAPLLMRYLTRSFTQNLINRQEDIDRALVAYVQAARVAKDPSREELFQAMVEEVLERGYLVNIINGIVRLGGVRKWLGVVYGVSSKEEEKEMPTVTSEATMELFSQILLEARKCVQSWNGRLYFVYLPQWQRYGQPELAREHRARVLLLVRQLGIPVIDIHLAFLAQGDPLALFPFRRYGRYNVEGHRVVAEEVLRHISSEGRSVF